MERREEEEKEPTQKKCTCDLLSMVLFLAIGQIKTNILDIPFSEIRNIFLSVRTSKNSLKYDKNKMQQFDGNKIALLRHILHNIHLSEKKGADDKIKYYISREILLLFNIILGHHDTMIQVDFNTCLRETLDKAKDQFPKYTTDICRLLATFNLVAKEHSEQHPCDYRTGVFCSVLLIGQYQDKDLYV